MAFTDEKNTVCRFYFSKARFRLIAFHRKKENLFLKSAKDVIFRHLDNFRDRFRPDVAQPAILSEAAGSVTTNRVHALALRSVGSSDHPSRNPRAPALGGQPRARADPPRSAAGAGKGHFTT